jgi:hypothetical protein
MLSWLTRPFSLGVWFQLKITITPLAMLNYIAVLLIVAAITLQWPGLSLTEAIVAGIFTALAMFVFETIHQLGHAWAARSVGYPMRGIYNFSVLSASIYPKDEPVLPPIIHIRRALGGFWINILFGLLFGVLAMWLWPINKLWGWVTAFTAFYNFFVLGVGALLPIDIPGIFTIDGGTILRNWREMQKEKTQRQ